MLLVSQRLDSPRMDPLLPGSLKRKLTGTVEGSASLNGVSDTSMTHGGAKRLCLEDVTLARGSNYPQPLFPSGMGNQGGVLEGNRLNSNNNSLGSPYSVPPIASPGSASGGGGGSGGLTNNFNLNGSSATPSVEQELQEILDELTNNPDPTLPQLDIEKILGKESDDQAINAGGFVHPEGNGTPKRSPQRQSHLEAHLTQSPGFSQAGSPQMGPSPAGAPYTLPQPSKPVPSPLSASPLSSSSSQGQNQARSPMLTAALSSRPASNWHEVSRAQHLQQMASNSKHHSNTSAGQPPAQSGLSGLGQQGTSWAGPSPPYRSGDKLPNSSPHQQPFSPAGNNQNPQSSLISSMAPAPSTGPSPPYRPEKLASPAIAQPPFSPQNSLLSGNAPSGGLGTTIQGSQASYLPGVVPTSSSTRPSPPYRPDKHPNPVGQCQPGTQPPTQGHLFNTQNNQPPGMSSQLFKAMTSTQPPNSLLMQARTAQGKPSQLQISKATTGGMGPEPYSFNNTKPLRHFDPDPSVTKLGPLAVGGYRSASMQSTPPTSATGHARLLPQHMQRGMQAGGIMPHCRDDQGAGMVPHLQDSPSAVQRQPQGSNYNLLLKNQLLSKHLQQQQEKQRQMEQMNGAQITDCQQVSQFQGPGRPLPPECGGYAMGPSQQPNPTILSHSGPLPTNRMGLSSGSVSQMGPSVGGYMCNKGSKQPLCHPSQDFGMAMQPGQIIMGMGGPPRQPLHPAHGVTRPGVPCPNLTRGPVPTHHLRQALHQVGALPSRMMFPSQQQPSSQSQLWQHHQGVQPHMDPATLQHPFPSGGAPPGCGGSQFPQRSSMAGMPNNFPGARPPPNQVAHGLVGRQEQKIPTGQPLPSISQHSLRIRGPLSALAVMKPGGPSMMHPVHGMAPPSYQTASAGKHCSPQGYGPGHNPGHKLPSYDYTPQHQSNGAMGLQGPGGGGGGGGEVDFIDTLVGSSEDWLNNLTMIDEYLEQNS
ncbi:mastermind-like domain-containing protein 1 isoform X2 [Xyrauchen texanus]|uniref:mastermind-like domain-containing protein 1 isoform X2 n=1 Tax=Xyrauchen texanus TaxID=154827 RepID=UPI002242AFEB|nr:mastermind-like domain-containing protein 1 isoform X2 [Xyrauchen texanus]